MRATVLLAAFLLGISFGSTTALSEIKVEFPIQIEENSYVRRSYRKLRQFGFDKYNTIPNVGLCRDEITTTFLDAINGQWAYKHSSDALSFSMHSLAGLVILGKTGVKAALSHAPHDRRDGKKHYVFYAFTHIGFNHEGHPGHVERIGIKESHACGALLTFRGELANNTVNLAEDKYDYEQINLKNRLRGQLGIGAQAPSISDLTKVAYKAIVEDLEKVIKDTTNCHDPASKCDYAIFTGVQLNGGSEGNYIWPGTAYAVVNGKKHDFPVNSWRRH